MTREFLRSLGLEDEKIDQIMTQYGQDIEKAKGDADTARQQLAEKDSEINGLKEQITQRDADIKTLKESSEAGEGFKAKLEELQSKYDTDTKALNDKLTAQRTEFETAAATEKFFANVKFSSALAKEAAIAQFKAKALKLDNGVFQGGKEWLEDLRKNAPDAFAQEEQDKPEQKPRFAGGIKPTGGEPNANPFNFNFTPLHPENGGNK